MEAIEDCRNNGHVYVEFRFCPHLLSNTVMQIEGEYGDNCTNEEKVTPTDVLETVLEASKEAEILYPNIKCRYIMCALWPFTHWTQELVDFCKQYMDRGVVGLDIAGSPEQASKSEWKEVIEAFNDAKQSNINITVHAGECQGPDSCVQVSNTQLTVLSICY